jgi:serine/threonine-protein kinase HipA
VRKLEVRFDNGTLAVPVGTLALDARRVYFEYDPSFVRTGLQLSPFRLPCKPGLQEHVDREFGPLFGVFADSLPDGWGLLLMDREFRRSGMRISQITPFDRLAYLGNKTMGALTYHPGSSSAETASIDLAEIARESRRVLSGTAAEVLPVLREAGGSAAGARPKILAGVDTDANVVSGAGELPEGFTHYLIKFNSQTDPPDIGAIELAYARMASLAGISVPESRVFETSAGNFFGARRFDRSGHERVHMHTVSGLLHADHRLPSIDYETVLFLTRELTKDEREVAESFRRMVFNILAHNRDDHAKNFSFLMRSDGEWRMSPAYDLVYSEGPGGEHSTSVSGEGASPAEDDMMRVAERCGFDADDAREIIARVRQAVSKWPELADSANVSQESKRIVADAMRRVDDAAFSTRTSDTTT